VRRAALAVALVFLVACTSGPGERSAQPPRKEPSATGSRSSKPGASPDAPSPSAAAPSTGRSVRVDPPEGGTLLVRGTYPRTPSPCVDPERRSLLARYPGTLSVERSDDATMALTVTLPFDRYLEGIAEVPPTWPRAALEAQAIAARSYALATTGWSGDEGEPLPTPICATTACQVYRGIPVPREPGLGRWYAAVRRTDGKVLLHDGRPATTVYFSTSNGRTYGNEDVFGSSPLSYLRPVVERDDGASPTSHWRVRLPFADLEEFLERAGTWPRSRSISDVRLDGSTVVVSGEGASRSIGSSDFRDAVNVWGPCLEPDTYPPPSWKGTTLPVTIPSRWMRVSTEADAVVATGRGWGHGAGMVQWGAYGKALRGLSAPEILAFYYGGLLPRSYPEPGLIHVEVASGLTSLRIVPSGPGAELDGESLGPGRITIVGGEQLSVELGRS
jgi:stage II sporulation protein D